MLEGDLLHPHRRVTERRAVIYEHRVLRLALGFLVEGGHPTRRLRRHHPNGIGRLRLAEAQSGQNVAHVGGYRLLGYENRALADEDFNNDKKDAGEIGVGHTVTALYEIIPAGSKTIPVVDPLKYQTVVHKNDQTDEILTVKLRYKPLKKKLSLLLSQSLRDNQNILEQTSINFRFAAAVAGYGLLLQHSEYGRRVHGIPE